MRIFPPALPLVAAPALPFLPALLPVALGALAVVAVVHLATRNQTNSNTNSDINP